MSAESPTPESQDSESKPETAASTAPAPQAGEQDFSDIEIKHSSTVNAPNQVRIDLPRVLDLGCGILVQLVLQAKKDKAKNLFKRLKAGDQIALGAINVGQQAKLKLNLALDYSAYDGPGFNSDVFRASVDQLVKKIGPRLRAKQNLGIRTDNQGSVLFDIPAGVRVKGFLNVMMIVMDLQKSGEITMRLSYFDPAQFQVKD